MCPVTANWSGEPFIRDLSNGARHYLKGLHLGPFSSRSSQIYQVAACCASALATKPQELKDVDKGSRNLRPLKALFARGAERNQ